MSVNASIANRTAKIVSPPRRRESAIVMSLRVSRCNTFQAVAIAPGKPLTDVVTGGLISYGCGFRACLQERRVDCAPMRGLLLTQLDRRIANLPDPSASG